MTDLVQLGFSANTSGLTKAQVELDKTTAAGGRLDKQSVATSKALGLVGTAIAAIGVTASAQQIIKYSDSWANLNTQLRQVTSSEEQLLSVREQLLKVSRETRIDLDATVGLYAEMTRGTSDLNVSSDKLVEITKTLNNLFLAGGKPLSEMTGAIRQLNQGFASGVLRGDEFNSVAEGAPRIMDALTASLGKTRGELRAFAATGGITSAVMVKALQDYSGTAQKLANTVQLTFEQTMGLVGTNITQFVGESDALNSSVSTLGNSLLSLSENIEATAYSLGAAGAVIATAYGVKVTSALASSVSATYAKIKADGEALVAQRLLQAQEAKTTLSKLESAAAETNLSLKSEAANAARLRSSIAAFDAEFALEMQRQKAQISEIGRIQSGVRMSEINASRAIATNQLAASETALSAAVARTTAAEAAATAAKGRLGAATASVTAATVAQTTASRALGVATSFLMGPWGLLIAAVGVGAATFLTASNSIDEATKSADEHANKISRLEGLYNAMSKAQLGTTYVESQQRAIELDEKRLAITEKLELAQAKEAESNQRNGDARSAATNIYTAQVSALQSELGSLDAEIEKNNESLETMSKVFDSNIDSISTTSDVTGKAAKTYSELYAENEKLTNSYAAQLLAIQSQSAQLSMTADEFEVYSAIQSAAAYGATPAMTAAIVEQVKAMQAQRNAISATNTELEGMMSGDLFGFGDSGDATDKISDDLSKLIDKVDDFGGAWSRTGNIIADSMGDAVDVLNDYAKKMQGINDLQGELTEERGKYADGTKEAIKIDAALADLQRESSAAQIGAIGKTIGLSSELFAENSKERKALHALEMGFMAAEISLAAEKAIVTAVGAVANQGSGDPYTAFGRIAAMVGIMAGVLGAAGIAFSGGGGGSYEAPDDGGTGTVLGDSSAQSASIANALEDFDDIQIDQLAELRGIKAALAGLSGGIERLASQFAQGLNFGDEGYSGQLGTIKSSADSPIMDIAKVAAYGAGLAKVYDAIGDPLFDAIVGGFSSTKKKLVDSGISFITQSIGEIFDSGALGAEMYQVIEKTKKKFWGLSKSTSTSTETTDLDSSITQQMASIFGYIGDSVIGAIDVFGINTEDNLRKTLDNFMIDIGEVSFLDKTGDEIQEELEAIFSQQADLIAQYLMPAITDYQDVGEGAFETLQRVSQEQAIFNDAIERTGVNLKDLNAILQIDIAQSIIGLVGGAEQFSELANDFFSSFYSEAEQLDYLKGSITDVFDQLGLSVSDSKSAFRDLVESVDLTTEEGQQLYATLLQLSPSMGEYLDALDDLANDKLNLQIELLEAQGKAEEALALSRQMQLDGLDESLRGIQQQIWAQEELNDIREAEAKALEEYAQKLEDNVSDAEDVLDKARDAEVARLESVISKAQEAYQLEIASINAQRTAYNSLISELTANVAEAANKVEETRTNELNLISANLDAARAAYDNQLAYIDAQRTAYNDLISELESNLSSAESAVNNALNSELSRYDDLISAAESKSEAEIKAIESASSARIAQLNDERSILASVVSQFSNVQKSISATEALQAARAGNFELAQSAVSGSGYTSAIDARIGAARDAYAFSEIGRLAETQLSEIDRQIAASESSAEYQVSAINKASDNEIAELEAQKELLQEQVDALLGVDNTVLSLAEAMKQYQAADAALSAQNGNGTLERLEAQEAAALANYEAQQAYSEYQIAALNNQIDALLGIDNSVLSLEEATEQYNSAQEELDKQLNSGTLEALQEQEDIALATYEAIQADSEKQIELINTQVDAMLNINDSVLGLAESMAELDRARSALASLTAESQIEQVNAQYATIEAVNIVNESINKAARESKKEYYGDWPNFDPIGEPVMPPITISRGNEELVSEIKNLRKDLDNANAQIGENTKKTADSVRRLEYINL